MLDDHGVRLKTVRIQKVHHDNVLQADELGLIGYHMTRSVPSFDKAPR